MIGTPKYLNTKDDIELGHKMAVDGKIPADVARQAWQGLLNAAYCYKFDRVLADTEAADGPEPDYLVLEAEASDGTIVRRQVKRVRDTNSRMDRLGYTEAVVQAKIAELGG